ncbi:MULTISPECIES: FAD-dependent oxidoreductase [unclassified Paraflavitalea]|uniref:FAD-dependent oxidoreductase n=1 Tax=unclassified Paraflavitalea TaxID=2798305 RepID=UPI003D336CB0
MNRRSFIQAASLLSSAGFLLESCSTKLPIKVSMVGANSKVGHLIREGVKANPTTFTEVDTIIIGGGISGLVAGRELHKNQKQFLLLELDKEVGGNAAFGSNKTSEYPWGAHYIPIPNNHLIEYLQFLEEEGIVQGYDENQLPIYKEEYICFDSQERLFINGKWQEGLVPKFGLLTEDESKVASFLKLMEVLKEKKGSDGKWVFDIPIANSSKDEEWLKLDQITMIEWLKQQSFFNSHLENYINYCTRDDFGTSIYECSAWIGLHYFAARKGKGANVKSDDVITWPEGNGFLVKKLREKIKDQIRTNALVTEVQPVEAGIKISVLNPINNESTGFLCKQLIIATPQFITNRIWEHKERAALVKTHFEYVPWLVANINCSTPLEISGAPLSWDNVCYGSLSLGYVNATHQLLNQKISEHNFTLYIPLSEKDAKAQRQKAYETPIENWKELVLQEMKRVYPNFESNIISIEILLWGHAMVKPKPGLVHGPVLGSLAKSPDPRIHFAHTDLAGISIFEEAFYQGLNAAKNCLNG